MWDLLVDESKPVEVTLAEAMAAMTGAQKTGVLNAYSADFKKRQARFEVKGVKGIAIFLLYDLLDDVKATCAQYVRGQVETDPGDPSATPPVPPTYNTPPATLPALKASVAPLMVARYDNAFTEAQIGVAIDKMVICSKKDSTGSWAGTYAIYKNNI